MAEQSISKIRGALSYEDMEAIESKIITARAVADVLMCGGAKHCAPETVGALGELLYNQLGEVGKLLGIDIEEAR